MKNERNVNAYFYCNIFLGQFNVPPIIEAKQSSIKADCIIYNQQIILKAVIEIYFNRKQLFNFNIRMFGKNIREQPHEITFFPFLLCFSPLFFSQLFVRPAQTAISVTGVYLQCCLSLCCTTK